jgi:serpin B
VTVSDDLRVRSAPGVGADSLRYVPLLGDGAQLLVTGGPVDADGYRWMRVAPLDVTLRTRAGQRGIPVDQGWVAVADHDGTAWVAPAKDPTPGFKLASAEVDRQEGSVADARRAAAAQNAFGLDLYRRMLADPTLGLDGKGVVMSPTSIVMALAMARAGARGDTAAEMDAVLGLAGWDAASAELSGLDARLRSRDRTWEGDDGVPRSFAFRMANMAFGQEGETIAPAYLERIARTFGAPLGLVDYIEDTPGAVRAINGWVERQTLGRIRDLLSEESVTPATRLVLVNTVYLKGRWAMPFPESSTRDRPFTTADGTTVEVPTMRHVQAALPVASGDGWRATELGYDSPDGPGLSMTLIVPDDLERFEARLQPSVLAEVDRRLEREWDRVTEIRPNPDRYDMDCGAVDYATTLWLPRFGVDLKGDLVRSLEAAGMHVPFRAEADFGGMGDAMLHIGAVIHQATIDVDEEGTEAAAATAVGMDTSGGCGAPEPDTVRVLRFDRPFLYLLRDRETGAILFLGRVVDPSER